MSNSGTYLILRPGRDQMTCYYDLVKSYNLKIVYFLFHKTQSRPTQLKTTIPPAPHLLLQGAHQKVFLIFVYI